MNILQIEDTLKGIPDEVLMQEAQAPSGSAPQYLVISEIQRRTDMRERFSAEQEQPESTVSDQIVNKGIMSLGGPSAAPPAMNGQSPMPQQAMPQQAMPQPPMPQAPMPEQQMPPPQMMNVGGEVMLDEADDASVILDELSSSMNKIPDNRERDLYMAEFGDSVLSGFPSSMNAGQRSVPNAILEDANKFRPEQMLDITPEELAVLQGAEADLPEVLNYAGGGIVELQEGGQPEDDPSIWEKGWEYAKANPLDVISTAAMAIPVGGWGLAGALKGLSLGHKALKGTKFLNRILGIRPHSFYSRPADPLKLTRRTTRTRGVGRESDQGIGEAARKLGYGEGSITLGRQFSPLRASGLMYGAGLLGSQFTGDDAEAEAADTDDTTLSPPPPSTITHPQVTGGDDQGPEPGSLEWIREEHRKIYESGGGEREEKLQEILSRQREQGTLMQEQARSDMITSALMNLGAGIAAGDPSEGLRLAANAVEGIRSAAREGSIAQQNVMDELELAGIDVDQAEKVASLASMADIERLDQQRIQLRSSAVDDAFRVIQAQAEALSQQSLRGGEVIEQVDLAERIARAYQLALTDPHDQNAYMEALLNPAGGEFTDLETGQVY
tara:strand:+ start:233 stop:2068 length:1836 start_codon:yes stop_codon:yes gene_type:complete